MYRTLKTFARVVLHHPTSSVLSHSYNLLHLTVFYCNPHLSYYILQPCLLNHPVLSATTHIYPIVFCSLHLSSCLLNPVPLLSSTTIHTCPTVCCTLQQSWWLHSKPTRLTLHLTCVTTAFSCPCYNIMCLSYCLLQPIPVLFNTPYTCPTVNYTLYLSCLLHPTPVLLSTTPYTCFAKYFHPALAKLIISNSKVNTGTR